VYRILWKRSVSIASDLSARSFPTVTEAMRVAQEELAGQKEHGAVGFEIVWAGSGRPLADWYRQTCLERGK
jgi:hypothetical protein